VAHVQKRVCGLAVATGSATLLVEGFDRLWHAPVHHISDMRNIDSHP
jgi:hypothetical protein